MMVSSRVSRKIFKNYSLLRGLAAETIEFVASTATTWGDGHQWERIQPLLETLVEKGILNLASDNPADHSCERKRLVSDSNSLLPSALSSELRSWQECESITQEFAGHSVELAYLELIIPMFRVAHIAMDSDGRQVGEANVFPAALRLDTKTEWKTCPYSGSRFQDVDEHNSSTGDE